MCVNLIMEPEEKKMKIYPSAIVQWERAIVFQFFFSLWKFAFSYLAVSRGRQGVEFSIQGTLTLVCKSSVV